MRRIEHSRLKSYIVLAFALLFLYLTSLYNYLLFHSLVELFSIVTAIGIFMIVWNSRAFLRNGYLLFLGIAFQFIALMDLVHMLSYKGMGIFADFDANLPTQLWIGARYLQAASFLLAPLFVKRRFNRSTVFLGFSAVFSLLMLSIFYWRIFPDCFIEGKGLTPFKIGSEYIISLLLLGAVFGLYAIRKNFAKDVFQLLLVSILFTIASELAFTKYISVYGPANMLGHFFKVLAYIGIYTAVIQIGLTKPFRLLFRELKSNEEALKGERDFISAILNTAGALVTVLGRNGEIASFNQACEDATGYKSAEVMGKPFWDILILPKEKDGVKKVFAELTAGHFPSTHEHYWVAKDGSLRLIDWTNTALLDEKGNPEFIIATGIDITERRQAEREKERLIKELTAALENIKTLKGLLPMCAWCKKIRDGKGYWNKVEAYIEKHSQASFTHGICPECLAKVSPEFYEGKSKENSKPGEDK